MDNVRIDYRHVRAEFTRFVGAMGGRVANSPLDDGGYWLDRDGAGWRIEKISLRAGAPVDIFGGKKMTSAQIISHMKFAVDAIIARERPQGAFISEDGANVPVEDDPDMRVMKTIYTVAKHATKVDRMLQLAHFTKMPFLDYDTDWDVIKEEDDRCDFCKENNIENCRHIGM